MTRQPAMGNNEKQMTNSHKSNPFLRSAMHMCCTAADDNTEEINKDL